MRISKTNLNVIYNLLAREDDCIKDNIDALSTWSTHEWEFTYDNVYEQGDSVVVKCMLDYNGTDKYISSVSMIAYSAIYCTDEGEDYIENFEFAKEFEVERSFYSEDVYDDFDINIDEMGPKYD